MSRSYHPYPFFQHRRDTLPRPDNSGDPQIVVHHHTLTELNVVQGKLCTLIHDNEPWEEVPRVFTASAASGLHKVWAPYASPFFCPHRWQSGLTYDPLVLHLNGIHQGGSADFYRAVDHQCDFKVFVIPPVTETHILRTWQDCEDFDWLKHGDQDDNDEDPQGLASSQGTSSSAISSLEDQQCAWSVPQASHQACDTTPRSGSPSLQSFYSAEVAEARKHSDVGLDLNSDVDALKYLDEITDEGLLERMWSSPFHSIQRLT
ncbi:hypothetical protein K438DRAFT_1939930 [Mycena galopus ATCC 62051]|nr:hypothetical protein K438DRAFT_1939930 [Mycena galopus ATCC 62051]